MSFQPNLIGGIAPAPAEGLDAEIREAAGDRRGGRREQFIGDLGAGDDGEHLGILRARDEVRNGVRDRIRRSVGDPGVASTSAVRHRWAAAFMAMTLATGTASGWNSAAAEIAAGRPDTTTKASSASRGSAARRSASAASTSDHRGACRGRDEDFAYPFDRALVIAGGLHDDGAKRTDGVGDTRRFEDRDQRAAAFGSHVAGARPGPPAPPRRRRARRRPGRRRPRGRGIGDLFLERDVDTSRTVPTSRRS